MNRLLAACLLTTLLAACQDTPTSCTTEDDCFSGELCSTAGKCIKRPPGEDMTRLDMPSPADMDMSAAPDLPTQDMPDGLDMPGDSGPDLPVEDDMGDPDQADQAADPCAGITCSGIGTCSATPGQPSCACPPNTFPAQDACITAATTTISAGQRHTCLSRNGKLSCWGDSSSGQLGLGDTAPINPPTTVPPFGTGVSHVAAGASHTCVIAGGSLACWGSNSLGQLGVDLTTRFTSTPGGSIFLQHATALAAGSTHTCAIHDGKLKCWGDNNNSQLGLGAAPGYVSTPTAIPSLTGVSHVAAGASHTCAIAAGTLRCWGSDNLGQLGTGSELPQPSPVLVSSLTDVTHVAAGSFHTCAIADGALSCWGDNAKGQLGVGGSNFDPRGTPTAVVGMDSGVTAVAAGRQHTCAIKAGALYCWGFNNFGQLGAQDNVDAQQPRPVHAHGADTLAVAAGSEHTCSVSSPEGKLTVRCWGDNTHGQLGQPAATSTATPLTIMTP